MATRKTTKTKTVAPIVTREGNVKKNSTAQELHEAYEKILVENVSHEEIDALLSKISNEFEKKVAGALGLKEHIDALVEQGEAAIARAQAFIKARKNQSKALETFIVDTMHSAGASKIVSDTFSVTVTEREGGVEITDSEKVPEQYLVGTLTLRNLSKNEALDLAQLYEEKGAKAEIRVDKVAVKKAIKTGEEVSGCTLGKTVYPTFSGSALELPSDA